jgi:hypothetical protein
MDWKILWPAGKMCHWLKGARRVNSSARAGNLRGETGGLVQQVPVQERCCMWQIDKKAWFGWWVVGL